MNLICKILDHDWRYNFPTMPTKRICHRCKIKQKVKLDFPIFWETVENFSPQHPYMIHRKWVKYLSY